MAVSGDHGAAFPNNRGSKRSVRLCLKCLQGLNYLMKQAMRKAKR